MPEGPECHAAAKFLRRQFRGRRLMAIIIAHGRYTKKDPGGWDILRDSMLKAPNGILCRDVRVHGKMIYALLDGDLAIISTLGLTGKWQTRCAKHAGLCLVLDRGKLWFKDQLHYGTLTIATRATLESRLRKLGPDCTQGPQCISREYWAAMCEKHQKKELAVLLMNQSIIAGVGNYLKNEILHAAALHPCTLVEELSNDARENLLDQVIGVTHEWWKYKMRITTKRPRMQVYRRRRDSAGNPVTKVKASDGRTSHTTLRTPPPEPSSTVDPICPPGCTH